MARWVTAPNRGSNAGAVISESDSQSTYGEIAAG